MMIVYYKTIHMPHTHLYLYTHLYFDIRTVKSQHNKYVIVLIRQNLNTAILHIVFKIYE